MPPWEEAEMAAEVPEKAAFPLGLSEAFGLEKRERRGAGAVGATAAGWKFPVALGYVRQRAGRRYSPLFERGRARGSGMQRACR